MIFTDSDKQSEGSSSILNGEENADSEEIDLNQIV